MPYEDWAYRLVIMLITPMVSQTEDSMSVLCHKREELGHADYIMNVRWALPNETCGSTDMITGSTPCVNKIRKKPLESL